MNDQQQVTRMVRAEQSQASWSTLIFFALVFGGLILNSQEEWQVNPQYAYGWGVPVLGIILAWKRWKDRPAAEVAASGAKARTAVIVLLLLWFPVRVVREANMDWRFVQWVIGLGGVSILLAGLYWTGGRSWVRHFLFPVIFFLVAVPWPTRVESLLVESSAAVVVRGSVEALRWMGYAAWSSGQTIQLPGATVGVDEACSGIRSFQGALMCALFLGELKRLPIWKRAGLAFLAAVLALLLNGARTVILTSMVASKGVASADGWHDSAGMITLFAVLILLWAVTRFLCRDSGPPVAVVTWFRPIPWRAAVSCTIWLACVETGTVLWFRSHEQASAASLPRFEHAALADLQPEPIPARVRQILRFDDGAAFRRTQAGGSMEWWIYDIGWERDGGGAPLARFHSPDVCLPAAGLKLVSRGNLFRPTGTEVPFRVYEFEWREKPVFVFSSFYASTPTGVIESMAQFDLTWGKRLQNALAGRRPADQRAVQVLISGANSERAAREAFGEFAARTLKHRA